MKFGGSSVADAPRLRNVAALVEAEAGKGQGVLVVLSALGGATDALIGAGKAAVAGDPGQALALFVALLERHEAVARELFGTRLPSLVADSLEEARREIFPLLRGATLLGELPARSSDLLAGRGELLSSALLAGLMGAPWVDAREVMRTDSTYGQARPEPEAIKGLAADLLLPRLGSGKVLVTQGYIGSDSRGMATTLGRGGSDYSASLFGAAIGAAEIQIWTDVEGVLTADPRVVPSAFPVELLGYDEAAELAAFGAKVLHPATILPAVEQGIPVTVRNSLVPGGRFTTISRGSSSGMPVTALASRAPVTVLTMRTPRMLGGSGFLARIFEVFGRNGTSVDLVSTSEVSVSVTLEGKAPLGKISAELAEFCELRVEEDRAVLALVGEELRRTPGIAARALGALGDINVEMISLGSNEINLSLIVASEAAAEAQRRLHAAFFGQGTPRDAAAQRATAQPAVAQRAAGRSPAEALA
jgi:aspartate kinase